MAILCTTVFFFSQVRKLTESDMEQETISKLGKEYVKAVYCRPAYLTSIQSQYIMWNAGLEEAQAGIKIAGRNINNLNYADDTTLVAEAKKELHLLYEGERGGWKSWLKTQHSDNLKIMASSSITSWQIDGKTVETVREFIFLGSKITADDDRCHEIKRCMLLGRKAMMNLNSILAETLLCRPRSL